jgi:hypothetical protein
MDYSGRFRPVRPLRPADDFNHPVEAHPFFNESRYAHLVDGAQGLGGWFRVGQRANQGFAEMTVCLYLPDGRVGFHFARPEGVDPTQAAAGGLRFEVVEAFQRRRLVYRGPLHVLPRGELMEDPRSAFQKHAAWPCEIDLELMSVAPAHGGELLGDDGQPFDEGEGRHFARAHIDQSLRGRGRIAVGDEAWTLDGHGLIDHSWGPRIWQAIPWYRWFPCTFAPDFAMCLMVVRQADGCLLQTGYLHDGGPSLLHIGEIALQSRYDDRGYPTGFDLRFVDERGRWHEVQGETVNAVPCRHVRRLDDGRSDRTRIMESLTRYRCGDRVGWGLAEYMDHVDAQGRFEGVEAGW